MTKYILDLKVVANEQPAKGYSLLKLTDCNAALPEMLPGQFVQIRACAPGGLPLLRRPISINFVDRTRNELWLLVHNVGPGTNYICSLAEGDTANIVLPLGNGFNTGRSAARHLLIGGGVGTAPLLYLGKTLRENGAEPTFLLGGRSAKDILQLDEFAKYGRVFMTTEDASAGEPGYVTQHSLLQREKFGFISTCGPKPMMKAVAQYARQSGTPCEASLENLMACGLGACLCCVEQTAGGHNVCVCKEGPVFNINQLTWLD
jgi:dihydroorotate dehydrogenase electron transfer subunit